MILSDALRVLENLIRQLLGGGAAVRAVVPAAKKMQIQKGKQ